MAGEQQERPVFKVPPPRKSQLGERSCPSLSSALEGRIVRSGCIVLHSVVLFWSNSRVS